MMAHLVWSDLLIQSCNSLFILCKPLVQSIDGFSVLGGLPLQRALSIVSRCQTQRYSTQRQGSLKKADVYASNGGFVLKVMEIMVKMIELCTDQMIVLTLAET